MVDAMPAIAMEHTLSSIPTSSLWARDVNDTQTSTVHGWVSSPNQRGTMDILWTCASTILVCVWVMLHLNIPAKKDGLVTIWIRKIKWFILGLLAPELLMLFAGGQWASAKRSVERTKQLGWKNWSLLHAFYADSGGFMLQPRDSAPFPVTAQQIQYLVENRYLQVPSISKEEIHDKSKADGFAKVIAGLQSAWFALQVIARGAQGLPVTLLELATIALMTCTATTLFFWYYKPLNVETPTILCIEQSTDEILLGAGEGAKQDWKYTPLDFAEPLAYTSTLMPLSKLWSVRARPYDRLPNDRDSLLHNWKIVVTISVPTATFKQMMWRYTCIGGGIILGVGCALEAGAIIASNYKAPGLETFNRYKLRWPWGILFFVPGAFYFLARFIVIAEVIASLRDLPTGSFETVDWTQFLPVIQ